MEVYIAFLECVMVTDKLLGVFSNYEDAKKMADASQYADFKCRIEHHEVIE